MAEIKTVDDTMASTAELTSGTLQTGDTNKTVIQSRTKSLLKHLRRSSQRCRKSLSKNLSSQENRRKEDQNEKAVNIVGLKKNDRVNKWLILELIGKGAFGCVYKVCFSTLN